jgi:ATP-dependent DNA helicase RecG
VEGAPGRPVPNPFLAAAMAQLNLVDGKGGGLRSVLRRQWARGLPIPDVDVDGVARVRVTVHGRVLDPAFAPLARAHPELSPHHVLWLDRVQKGRPLSLAAHRELREAGLVEGKYPLTVLRGAFALAAGRPVRHRGDDGASAPREAGNRVLADLVVEALRDRGTITRADVDRLVLPRLPATLDERQRRTKVDNIVKYLARAGVIANRGSRRYPQWSFAERSNSTPEVGRHPVAADDARERGD